jgi:group I intron endonuclease
MSSIYLVQNLVNGKCYVGKVDKPGKTVAQRWKEHCSGKGNADRLLTSIRCYGADKFICTEIESGLTVEQANEQEKWWIAKLGTLSEEIGYNQTKGGRGGAPATPEGLKRISETSKGRVKSPEECKHHSRVMKGRKFTKEHRDKIAAALTLNNGFRGKKHTPETLKEIGRWSSINNRKRKGIKYGPHKKNKSALG